MARWFVKRLCVNEKTSRAGLRSLSGPLGNWSRRGLELFAAYILVLSSACNSPLQSPPRGLALSVILPKTEFFEGEPIYAVFRLTNQGAETAWVNRFSIAEQRLHVSIQRLSERLPDTGPVVDFFPGPGWH